MSIAAGRCHDLVAKLGTLPCGPLRKAMDPGGLEDPSFEYVDARGHGLEISGSE